MIFKKQHVNLPFNKRYLRVVERGASSVESCTNIKKLGSFNEPHFLLVFCGLLATRLHRHKTPPI